VLVYVLVCWAQEPSKVALFSNSLFRLEQCVFGAIQLATEKWKSEQSVMSRELDKFKKENREYELELSRIHKASQLSQRVAGFYLRLCCVTSLQIK
jgi:hypothetical protein